MLARFRCGNKKRKETAFGWKRKRDWVDYVV